MNFTKPQDPVIINGFKVSFTEKVMPDGRSLWIPQRISRNEPGKCWRIALYHLKGNYSRYIKDHHRDPMESLQDAWKALVALMHRYQPNDDRHNRTRRNGPSRFVLVDTRVTGVHITRFVKNERTKFIEIVAQQQIQGKEGRGPQNLRYIVDRVTYLRYQGNPFLWDRRFHEAIKKAVAIRRFYDDQMQEFRRPEKLITYEDVPLKYKDMTYSDDLDLGLIFRSFVNPPPGLLTITRRRSIFPVYPRSSRYPCQCYDPDGLLY